MVSHNVNMDGASSGFKPHEQSLPPWQHLFKSKRSMLEIISDPEALASGFGYEECQKILMHDDSKYDGSGFCLDPDRLKKFIRQNIFASEKLLNYKEIFHKFIK